MHLTMNQLTTVTNSTNPPHQAQKLISTLKKGVHQTLSMANPLRTYPDPNCDLGQPTQEIGQLPVLPTTPLHLIGFVMGLANKILCIYICLLNKV